MGRTVEALNETHFIRQVMRFLLTGCEVQRKGTGGGRGGREGEGQAWSVPVPLTPSGQHRGIQATGSAGTPSHCPLPPAPPAPLPLLMALSELWL